MNHTRGYASHFISEYFMTNEPTVLEILQPGNSVLFVLLNSQGWLAPQKSSALKGYRACLKIVLWEYGHWTRLSVGDGFYQFCWIVSHQSLNQLFARPRIQWFPKKIRHWPKFH